MICPACQHANPASALHCAACGRDLGDRAPPPPVPGFGWEHPSARLGPRPDNHLVWAILSTLFCCLPAGVVAIVYAAQVDSLYDRGDLAGARAASDKARFWSWLGFGLVLAIVVLAFVLPMLLGVLAGLAGSL